MSDQPNGAEADPQSVDSIVLEAAQRWHRDLAEGEIADLSRYVELIERWNPRVNLTALRDRPAVVLRHVAEPLFLAEALTGAGPHLLDAGSGVGVPGIPLAIADRDRRITLVEAHGKKATFLREVVDELGLENVTIIEERLEDAIIAETIDRPVHVLAARGWTSGWGELLGGMAPLMAPGGRALLLTGEETERALRRHLARGSQLAPSGKTDWQRAADAQWTLRRSRPLPHLARVFLVHLELPVP